MTNRCPRLKLVLLTVALAGSAPAAAADLVLRAASGPYVDAVIGGTRLRLRVELDHAPAVTLNPDAAARAGLQGDGKWLEQIGPVKLRGRKQDLRLLIEGTPAEAEVRWHDRKVAADADGQVSIHALPFDSVTIERREAGPGEREVALQTKVHDNHGVYVPVLAGRRKIAVRLSFSRPRTSAPAAAGAALAQVHGGMLEPRKSYEEISLGVMRPVWPMQLATPLRFGGLAVPLLMVRASDFRGKHRLQRRQEEGMEGIVVTGERRSQDALYRITVGTDVLGRCSAATYSRASGVLRLRCAP